MVVRIEQQATTAKFWHNDILIGGCKYDSIDNTIDCQVLGKGCVITFFHSCWNDGKDMQQAIGRVKTILVKEYGEISFS